MAAFYMIFYELPWDPGLYDIALFNQQSKSRSAGDGFNSLSNQGSLFSLSFENWISIAIKVSFLHSVIAKEVITVWIKTLIGKWIVVCIYILS